MSILWAGGEDSSFPNGSFPPSVDTNSAHFRPGYARYAISTTTVGSPLKSTIFSGGSITSGWLSFRAWHNTGGTNHIVFAALGKSGTNSCLGVGIGSTSSKVAIFTWDGTTETKLAEESGASIPTTGILAKIDMQVISFGASGTVNLWVNGTLLITFTGNLVAGGITNLDSVFVPMLQGGAPEAVSEIIVADEDTRTFSLVTGAPTSLGTTDQWTGTYTDVNPTTINDANAVFTNVATQDEQFNITDAPAGIFFVRTVKLEARASNTSGATAVKLALGVNSGGTVAPGTLQPTTTAWATYESLLPINPVTGVAFTLADWNALQLNLRSGS